MTDEKQIEVLRSNFRQHVGKCIKKNFELKENGLCFRFNRLSINKIGCIKSVRNSVKNGFTPEQHFEAAENILDLFEYSKVMEQHYEKKPARTETCYLCISQITDNVYAWMNVVTWGNNDGYIDLYLSREAE